LFSCPSCLAFVWSAFKRFGLIFLLWQTVLEASLKRSLDTTDTDRKHKRERQESDHEGSTTASNDEHNSDSESNSREHFDEDAASLASIMLSIANSCGQRASKSSPSSAQTVVRSASSSVTGDNDDHDDEHDDDNSGDSSQVKKQRRREKNRASAQQSRQRKKYHLETLEVRVEKLERDRAALSTRVEALSAENRRLRALGQVGATSGDMDAVASAIKADEMAGISLLAQLAQAAQKLSALPV